MHRTCLTAELCGCQLLLAVSCLSITVGVECASHGKLKGDAGDLVGSQEVAECRLLLK